jgi:hypothetical protein
MCVIYIEIIEKWTQYSFRDPVLCSVLVTDVSEKPVAFDHNFRVHSREGLRSDAVNFAL